ncbi:MAG: single-stranded-DNA-specific exonuclease RecJ [Puniceicoccaceae bacterium]|nr:MAG: single-stranded-DNA-specific exonuclease RecJ [Puniceicoccaceae bacterium]
MLWSYSPAPPSTIRTLSRRLKVSPLLAELLWKAGIRDADAGTRFLHPRLADLRNPFLIPHLETAVERLQQAIAGGQSVVVFGDYDVDGVTSTALLVSILRHFGVFPYFVVPLRLVEGYGLSRGAIDRALERGRPDLFVALDCGTNSAEEVAYLQEQGVDVIVVDHHRSKVPLPPAAILVNPHVDAGQDPQAIHLCAVGLVFKLVHGLLKKMRQKDDQRAFDVSLRDYLDLVAMGTVADLVPLVGENRTFARHGLRILQKTRRTGLCSLMEISGMNRGERVNPIDISFRLGPRINASGRLGDAAVSVELLLNPDPGFCRQTAAQLDSFNRERQEIEREITEQAVRQFEMQWSDAAGVVLYSEDWHPGVVGIVASRVSRQFQRPAIVLGREGDLAKGSGRSVDGVNLVDVLGSCAPLLESWGGHPMAVGVSLPVENVAALQSRFGRLIRDSIGDDQGEAVLPIALWLRLEAVQEALLEDLDILHPFGQEHPEPVFATRGAVLPAEPEVFRDQHFRFSLVDARGRRLPGVAWNQAARLPPAGQPIDLAFRLVWNTFKRRRNLQLELVDWRPTLDQPSAGGGTSESRFPLPSS